jgi:hypothetical protein
VAELVLSVVVLVVTLVDGASVVEVVVLGSIVVVEVVIVVGAAVPEVLFVVTVDVVVVGATVVDVADWNVVKGGIVEDELVAAVKVTELDVEPFG